MLTRTLKPMPVRFTLLVCALSSAAFAGELKRPSGPVSPPGKSGSILCEYFRGIEGTSVEDLAKNPAFPNKPTDSMLLDLFEIPTDSDDKYGTAVRGYIQAPQTGNYTFWIASDDAGELWLSPTDNPKDKIKICQVSAWCPPRQWDTVPEQKSKPVALTAGRNYYIESLQKEGTGGDNLAVGWQLPDGKMERPIPGARLIPALIPTPPPPVTVAIQGALPRTPGFHKCMAKIGGGLASFDFPFLLYVPLDFGKTKSPTLLFLHGAGERGTDLEGVYGNGPHGHVRGDKNLRDKFPFLLIGPQCAPDWVWSQRHITKGTVALLDEILKQYGDVVDKERVYMTGLSLGGAGTWHVALEAPDRFAAIVPSDPRAVMPEVATERLKDLAVWIIAGGDDGDFAKGANEMFVALKNNVIKPQLMLVPKCGHGAWSFYYPKWEFYQWMLKWRRKAGHGTERDIVEPAKVAPPVQAVAVAKPAPPEPAKPVTPPAPPVRPVEVPKPAAVVVVAPKPEPALVKPTEAPKPAPAPAVVVAPVTPVSQSPVIAPKIPPAVVAKPPIAIAPNIPPAQPVVENAAKPVVPAPSGSEAPKAAQSELKAPTPIRFPYAQVCLLISAIFFATAAYFFTTDDD